MLRIVANGLRSLFRKEEVERELNEEIDTYLQMAIDEKMHEGMSREEALRAVRWEQGNPEAAKDSIRGARWESLVETSFQDLRFAVRVLRKSPGFAAVVVLTLALGVGVNTVIFSVVNAVLLQPLPYASPEQLVFVRDTEPETGNPGVGMSYPGFTELRDSNRVFS